MWLKNLQYINVNSSPPNFFFFNLTTSRCFLWPWIFIDILLGCVNHMCDVQEKGYLEYNNNEFRQSQIQNCIIERPRFKHSICSQLMKILCLHPDRSKKRCSLTPWPHAGRSQWARGWSSRTNWLRWATFFAFRPVTNSRKTNVECRGTWRKPIQT